MRRVIHVDEFDDHCLGTKVDGCPRRRPSSSDSIRRNFHVDDHRLGMKYVYCYVYPICCIPYQASSLSSVLIPCRNFLGLGMVSVEVPGHVRKVWCPNSHWIRSYFSTCLTTDSTWFRLINADSFRSCGRISDLKVALESAVSTVQSCQVSCLSYGWFLRYSTLCHRVASTLYQWILQHVASTSFIGTSSCRTPRI